MDIDPLTSWQGCEVTLNLRTSWTSLTSFLLGNRGGAFSRGATEGDVDGGEGDVSTHSLSPQNPSSALGPPPGAAVSKERVDCPRWGRCLCTRSRRKRRPPWGLGMEVCCAAMPCRLCVPPRAQVSTDTRVPQTRVSTDTSVPQIQVHPRVKCPPRHKCSQTQVSPDTRDPRHKYPPRYQCPPDTSVPPDTNVCRPNTPPDRTMCVKSTAS